MSKIGTLTRFAGASALALSLAVGAFSPAQADNVLRVANSGAPDSLDPHFATGTWENRIIGDMFLGLVTEARDGSVMPGGRGELAGQRRRQGLSFQDS